MKVFLSWSGDASKAAAVLLREWLPTVIQAVDPYMSDEDIAKGARWASALGAELEEAKAGIICLTHENIEKPWLHFEAGAISKSMDESRVSPLLLGLDVSDVRGPLAQFQATKMEKRDIRRLLATVNDAEGEKLVPERVLDAVFEKMWPDLQRKMEPIVAQSLEVAGASEPETDAGVADIRPILEELLETSRGHTRMLNTLSGSQSRMQVARRPVSRTLAEAAAQLDRQKTHKSSKLGPRIERTPVVKPRTVARRKSKVVSDDVPEEEE